MLHLLDGQLPIILDCGTDDFFAGVNQAFHEKLVAHEISHDYSTRPGDHNWDFWRESIKIHLIFFDVFLTKISNQANSNKGRSFDYGPFE